MPRNGGQGKGKPKLGQKGFGKALFRSHARTMYVNIIYIMVKYYFDHIW